MPCESFVKVLERVEAAERLYALYRGSRDEGALNTEPLTAYILFNYWCDIAGDSIGIGRNNWLDNCWLTGNLERVSIECLANVGYCLHLAGDLKANWRLDTKLLRIVRDFAASCYSTHYDAISRMSTEERRLGLTNSNLNTWSQVAQELRQRLGDSWVRADLGWGKDAKRGSKWSNSNLEHKILCAKSYYLQSERFSSYPFVAEIFDSLIISQKLDDGYIHGSGTAFVSAMRPRRDQLEDSLQRLDMIAFSNRVIIETIMMLDNELDKFKNLDRWAESSCSLASGFVKPYDHLGGD